MLKNKGMTVILVQIFHVSLYKTQYQGTIHTQHRCAQVAQLQKRHENRPDESVKE